MARTTSTSICWPLLSTDEVAFELNLSRRTVRRYVEAGLLPAIRMRGALRFDRGDVEAFLVSRRTTRAA